MAVKISSQQSFAAYKTRQRLVASSPMDSLIGLTSAASALCCSQDDKTAWVQMTVKIPSQQSFAAYNAKRELVAGSPDTPLKVVDTWVFERALRKDPSTR